MFAHLIGRSPERLWSKATILIAGSVASLQLLLVMPSVATRRARMLASTQPTPAVYILPLWPARPPKPSAERVQYTAAGSKPHPGTGISRGSAGEAREANARRPDRTIAEPPAPIPETYQGSRVYVEPQVERPVSRDPASDAPAYPEPLRTHGVEGSVVIRFIVDTLGRADSSTLSVVEVTHPAFAQAVRAALPHMKFIPAELGGRPVPQLVMQEFRFVIKNDPPARTDVGATRASKARGV